MLIKVALPLVICLLLVTPGRAADKDDLQGTWIIESLEIDGKKIKRIAFSKYIFAGDKVRMVPINKNEKELTITYTTDTAKKPRRIDTRAKAPDGKFYPLYESIYKIKGDTLTICSSSTSFKQESSSSKGNLVTVTGIFDQSSRPTKFASKRAELMVLKRK